MKKTLALLLALAMSLSLLTACGSQSDNVNSPSPDPDPIQSQTAELPSDEPADEPAVSEDVAPSDSAAPSQQPSEEPAPSQQPTLELSMHDATITYAGYVLKLTPTFTGTQASAITWSSSDEAVATVDQSGNVTSVAPGKAIITAQAGQLEATCIVRCRWTEEEEFPAPSQEPSAPPLSSPPAWTWPPSPSGSSAPMSCPPS